MQEYRVTVGEHVSGVVRFYKPGTDVLHRTDGPAIVNATGDKFWFQNDQRHRIDGPAIEWVEGYKAWYQNGQLHRTDGPAIEKANGTVEYWIDGRQLTEERFKKKTAPKPKEMTVAEIEALLGHTVKVVK